MIDYNLSVRFEAEKGKNQTLVPKYRTASGFDIYLYFRNNQKELIYYIYPIWLGLFLRLKVQILIIIIIWFIAD